MRVVAGLMMVVLAALAAAAVACGSGGASAGDRTVGAPTLRALPSADVTRIASPTAAATPVVAPSATTVAAPPTVPPPPSGQPTSAPPRPVATRTPVPPPPPPPPPPPSGQSLTVTAHDLAFSPRGLTAHAGAPLTITLSNQDAGVRHDITVYAPGGAVVAETSTIEGPASASLTFTPSAGTYPFKCSVHFAMTGTLSVQ